MSRAKLFLENFIVYGLGSVISKIIPLIMLPIITRLMPDTFYYGLNDISNIVISFGTSIAIMGMYDAMFRMFFENEDLEYKKEVCSSAFYFVFFSGMIATIILLTFRNFFSSLFFDSVKYSNLLIISAITIFINTISSIIIAPTRMLNRRKIFLITNTITPIIAYGVSVPMLLNKMYIMALPLAAFTSSLIMLIIFYLLNTDWFNFKKVNKELVIQMLKIGAPLMPGFLIYWIFNSCDRIFISKMLGTAEVGIYGVGSRVASISQFIYVAFAGGWQYFAFSTMKSDDQVELTSNILEYLAAISFAAIIILTPFSEIIFKTFFTGDYIRGSVVFPYLFLSPLILMLYQTQANQFLIAKKTWPSTVILTLGSIINVILNYFLIPSMGVEGAALATLIGYTVSVIVCSVVLKKMKLIEVSKRFLKSCGLVTVFFIVWRLVFEKKFILSFSLSILFTLIIAILYREEIRLIIFKIKSLLKGFKNKPVV